MAKPARSADSNSAEATPRTPARRRAAGSAEARKLNQQVLHILGPAMGVWLGSRGNSPLVKPWHWLTAIALIWAALWLVDGRSSEPMLVGIIAWGAVYFACAMYLAQTTTTRLRETISDHIIPFASAGYMSAVEGDLAKRYPMSVRVWLPLLVAFASLAAGWWALGEDLKLAESPAAERITPERWLWAVTYFAYFWTAAIAVTAGQFYLSFARCLDPDRDRLNVLGAANSPLVRGVSRLATQVLLFWTLIFLTIVSSMLLALPNNGQFRIEPDSWLLFTMVPISGFFSLGFGTIIYLLSESRVRSTLNLFASAEVARLQDLGNEAVRTPPGASPKWEEAKQLADLQDRIVAGARYGSRVGVTISVALPLLMPVVSVLVNLLT